MACTGAGPGHGGRVDSDDGALELTGLLRRYGDGAGRQASSGTPAIEVSHLTKKFGGRTAVADVSFSVTSLEQLLAHFQAVGDFRADFNPRVMALAIRGAIDQVPPRLVRSPDRTSMATSG